MDTDYINFNYNNTFLYNYNIFKNNYNYKGMYYYN